MRCDLRAAYRERCVWICLESQVQDVGVVIVCDTASKEVEDNPQILALRGVADLDLSTRKWISI